MSFYVVFGWNVKLTFVSLPVYWPYGICVEVRIIDVCCSFFFVEDSVHWLSSMLMV
jgi:hypothetical protein